MKRLVGFSAGSLALAVLLAPLIAVANPPREALSREAPNASAWALAPLEQALPPEVRRNLTYLREDLLDEGHSAPEAGRASYKAGSELCNLLIAAIDEHERAAVDAGFRAAQAEANTKVTSQALEARRNYKMSWPQYAREVDQRAEIQRQQNNKSALARGVVRVDWSKRVKEIQKALDEAYMRYRQALRQDPGYLPSAPQTAASGILPPMAIPVAPPSTPTETPPPAAPPIGKPFENSLGMRFVPVPGTDVLFCIHETRWKDYAEFAKANPGIDERWKNQTHDGFLITDRPADHPVVYVTWDDATAFCKWLSEKEKKTYRLPTDREWSVAVGLGRKEMWNPGDTPESVSKDKNEFPWGTVWPPPKGAGNYPDESRKAKVPSRAGQIPEGYDDGFPATAPVMSFAPNEFGLYDLGGNIWEWAEDWWNEAKTDRVCRGSSFCYGALGHLRSSRRFCSPPDFRSSNNGFRVVLAAPAPP